MKLDRRSFLRYGFSAIAAALSACTDRFAASTTQRVPPSRFEILIEDGAVFQATPNDPITLAWSESQGATSYEVELNGTIVVEGLTRRAISLGAESAGIGQQEGISRVRLRARNDIGQIWTDPVRFEVRPTGGIRSRRFDFEDDGPIDLTVPSLVSAITVGSAFAFGLGGKGASLRCTEPSDTRAYKNLEHLPVPECWLRMALRPRHFQDLGVTINIARIRSSAQSANEYLIWETGVGFRSTSIRQAFPTVSDEWQQVQLGVLSDGSVEVWVFDGEREYLAGRGQNPDLRGDVKDITSIGNNSPNDGISYEIWMDEIAIGRNKLPWANRAKEQEPLALLPIDPDSLPDTFSFVFGSCNVSSQVPYDGTAMQAAVESGADFFIHLGDFGYPDTGAYTSSVGGYLAFWSDMMFEHQLSRLGRRPWLYVASDHDLGGNNIDRNSVNPHALEAFAQFQSNPDPLETRGRFGSIDFDDGDITLIWLDTISERAGIDDADGPLKTCLGPFQKRWLLDLLAHTPARLIMIASQTSFAHESDSGWARYPTEREEVLAACQQAGGIVRWITGDHHSARWVQMSDSVVEWGAAPFAEVPQVCPEPAPFAEDSSCVSRLALSSGQRVLQRNEVLEILGQEQVALGTSYGRVSVDTGRKTATFEVRDSRGALRIDEQGRTLAETFSY